jgi:hypothetical protein
MAHIDHLGEGEKLMRKIKEILVVSLVTVTLAACSATTSPPYACGSVKEGSGCQNVEENYFDALSGKEGGQDAGKDVDFAAINSGVMRVWLAPWEDSAGIFRDQQFAYFVVDPGAWIMRANSERSAYSDGFRMLQPPNQKNQPAPTTNSGKAAPKEEARNTVAKSGMTPEQAKAAAEDWVKSNAALTAPVASMEGR